MFTCRVCLTLDSILGASPSQFRLPCIVNDCHGYFSIDELERGASLVYGISFEKPAREPPVVFPRQPTPASVQPQQPPQPQSQPQPQPQSVSPLPPPPTVSSSAVGVVPAVPKAAAAPPLAAVAGWSAIGAHGGAAGSRSHHSATLLGSRLYILCGRKDESALSSLAVFDFEFNEWQRPIVSGVPPAARYGHAAVALSADTIFVYGGTDGDRIFSDAFLLKVSPSQVTWVAVEYSGFVPRGRCFHAMTVVNGAVFVHGGHDGARYRSDLLRFNPVDGTWIKLKFANAPSPRAAHALFADEASRKLIFHGGLSDDGVLCDFLVCDLNSGVWGAASLTGPAASAALFGHAIVVAAGALILLGGASDQYLLSSCFVVQGGTLSSIRSQSSLPSPMAFLTAASYRSKIVVFGGVAPTGTLGAVLACSVDDLLHSGPPPAMPAVSYSRKMLALPERDDTSALLGSLRSLLPAVVPGAPSSASPATTASTGREPSPRSGAAPASGKILNVKAANRFIKAALSGNDRYDSKRDAVRQFLEDQRKREKEVLGRLEAEGKY